MTRTQIQLPDSLFLRARAFANREEISLAELVRHSLELFLRCAAPGGAEDAPKEEWTLPLVRDLRSFGDPFDDPEWRSKLYLRGVPEQDALGVAETAPAAVRKAPRGKGAK